MTQTNEETSAEYNTVPAPRLAYVTEVDISVNNGRGINEREFVCALRRAFPEEVTCILPSPAFPGNHHDSGIEYVRAHNHSALGYLPHITSVLARIRHLHRRDPFDAIVIRLEVTPLVPLAARLFLGIPVILKTLALYQHFARNQPRGWRLHQVASRILRPAFRKVVRNSIAADTPSGSLTSFQRDVFGLSAAQIRTVPNGCNLSRFSPGDRRRSRADLGLSSFDKLVGYVGILSAFRNLDTVLRSFARLDDDGLGLLMVGDGDLRPQLQELAESLGISDRVVFSGHVPYSQVPVYLGALDIALDLTLVPLDSGRHLYQASFSQKIPQYLATGITVVAWDVADNRFLTEAGVGSLARVGDEADLTRAMGEQIENVSRAPQVVARKARNYAASNFGMDHLVAERMGWWRTILRDSAATPEGRT